MITADEKSDFKASSAMDDVSTVRFPLAEGPFF